MEPSHTIFTPYAALRCYMAQGLPAGKPLTCFFGALLLLLFSDAFASVRRSTREFRKCAYMGAVVKVPAHRNHVCDPASVFLSTH